MNTRFCAVAGCGHPTQYTSIKPNFCAKCGAPFSAAFATLPVHPPAAPQYQPPAPQHQTQPQYQAPQSHRTFRPARGRNSPDPYAGREVQSDQRQESREPDEYVDRDSMYDQAQALASTISASDFICAPEKSGTFKVSDIPSLVGALQQQSVGVAKTAKPVKITRRAKKS